MEWPCVQLMAGKLAKAQTLWESREYFRLLIVLVIQLRIQFLSKMSISSVFNRNDKSKISRLRKKLGEWHLGCWGFTRISGCLSGWFAPVPTNSMLTDLNVNPNVNPVIHNTLCRLNMILLVRKEKFCVDLSDYLPPTMDFKSII